MLTKQELIVLNYLCQGLNNNEIGELMFISKHTVKAHVQAILRKLKVANRTKAAYIAGKNSIT